MRGLKGYKKKTLTSSLKRLSIEELEILNRTGAEELKSAIDEVLLAKKILYRVKEKYEKL